MRITVLLLLTSLAGAVLSHAADAPSAVDQIAAATLAAPEPWRDGAGVEGYDESGKLVTLRKGTNHLVCQADDASREGFLVACFHRGRLPYMTRKLELMAQGVRGKASNAVLTKEVEDGKLAMKREPTTIHLLSGSGFNASTLEVADAVRVWVIATPYATSESLGLASEIAAPGVPWIMYAGTPGAHIMNSPRIQ
jgi:hypothetical protein